MGAAELDRLARYGSEAGRFLVETSQGYRSFHRQFGVDGYWVHDSTAAAYVAAPSLFHLRAGPVRVVTEGIAIGQTIQRDWSHPYPPGDWDLAPDQNVAVAVDAGRVLDLLVGVHIDCLTTS
jgi:inosine-uridine nucleoside N-ribohydrolase